MLLLEGHPWIQGAADAHDGDKDTGGGNSGKYSLA